MLKSLQIKLTFFLLFSWTCAFGQPPMHFAKGFLKWNGQRLPYGGVKISVPAAEVDSIYYYSVWLHGDSILPITVIGAGMVVGTEFTVVQSSDGVTLSPHFTGPRDSTLIKIKYSPTSGGLKSGGLIVSLNTNFGYLVQIEVLTTPIPMLMSWQGNSFPNGSSVFLGNSELNSNSTFPVWLRNASATPITISALTLSGNPGFTNTPLANPVTVNAQDSIQVPIMFSTSSLGKKSAKLTVTSSPINFIFDLSATGINAPTGTKSEISTGRNVYPNPATERIYLSGEISSPISYQIFDGLGKMVKQGKVFQNQIISVQDFNTGIYRIQWNESNKSFSRVIVKN